MQCALSFAKTNGGRPCGQFQVGKEYTQLFFSKETAMQIFNELLIKYVINQKGIDKIVETIYSSELPVQMTFEELNEAEIQDICDEEMGSPLPREEDYMYIQWN